MKFSLGDGRKGCVGDQNQAAIIAARPSQIFQNGQVKLQAV
jgi:hypothetical protein